jgi:hypothetical protein
MLAYEKTRQPEPSVCALYFHFFLSLFALVECCLFLGLLAGAIIALCACYYFIICASCGKWVVPLNDILAALGKLYAIYSSFLCIILGNMSKSLFAIVNLT